MRIGYPSTRWLRRSGGVPIGRKIIRKRPVIGTYDEDHNSSSARRASNVRESLDLWG